MIQDVKTILSFMPALSKLAAVLSSAASSENAADSSSIAEPALQEA